MMGFKANPPLLDYLYVASRLPEDEKHQIEAFSGTAFTVDGAANGNYNLPGPKFGLYAGNEVLAVGGFLPVFAGTYRDWFLSTPLLWEKHWFAATRHLRKLMDEILGWPDVRVLECYSLASRTAAHRWYRPLGYSYETTLHGRASGEDVFVYTRVKHGQ